MPEYLTIYAGLGISITRGVATSEREAAEAAHQGYDMGHRDGDTVYVVPLEHVTTYPVEVPAGQLGERSH